VAGGFRREPTDDPSSSTLFLSTDLFETLLLGGAQLLSSPDHRLQRLAGGLWDG
jgi:hypothetical protein